MEMDTLIQELNLLWEPIRPYLAKQIEELYGRRKSGLPNEKMEKANRKVSFFVFS